MPVLRGLAERFAVERPLERLRIAGCLHITTETANLAWVLTAPISFATHMLSARTRSPVFAAFRIR